MHSLRVLFISTAPQEKKPKNTDYLSQLPARLLTQSLCSFLNPASAGQLAKTSRLFANLSVYKKAGALFNTLLAHVLQLVAEGKMHQAQLIFAFDPELLLSEGATIDYSGRKLEGTALRIALGARDIDVFNKKGIKVIEGMVEMIESYLVKLPEGKSEIAAQKSKQFGIGWAAKERQRVINDRAALKNVFDAIVSSKSNEACKTDLQAFRNYVKPKSIIRTGLHFNDQLLMDAYNLLEENFKLLGGCNGRKTKLFCNKIIGYIQRFVPANYAQAIAQWIRYIMEYGQPFARSLAYNLRADKCYFPLASAETGLGYDHWAGQGGALPCTSVTDKREGWEYKSYLQAKTHIWQRTIPQEEEDEESSNCLTM